jgi:hypothetical protein
MMSLSGSLAVEVNVTISPVVGFCGEYVNDATGLAAPASAG